MNFLPRSRDKKMLRRILEKNVAAVVAKVDSDGRSLAMARAGRRNVIDVAPNANLPIDVNAYTDTIDQFASSTGKKSARVNITFALGCA